MNTMFKQSLSILAAVCALTTSASAITWVDRDPDTGNGPLQFLSENGTITYTSTFNIADAGFIPGVHFLSTIDVSFAFADDGNDDEEDVDIWVGSVKIWNDLEVDGNHTNAPTSYDWYSQSLTSNVSIFGDLSTDGILSYEVKIQNRASNQNDRMDTYLKIAQLTATGDRIRIPTGDPVPDGGATLGLLGLGMLGLGALRKKLS